MALRSHRRCGTNQFRLICAMNRRSQGPNSTPLRVELDRGAEILDPRPEGSRSDSLSTYRLQRSGGRRRGPLRRHRGLPGRWPRPAERWARSPRTIRRALSLATRRPEIGAVAALLPQRARLAARPRGPRHSLRPARRIATRKRACAFVGFRCALRSAPADSMSESRREAEALTPGCRHAAARTRTARSRAAARAPSAAIVRPGSRCARPRRPSPTAVQDATIIRITMRQVEDNGQQDHLEPRQRARGRWSAYPGGGPRSRSTSVTHDYSRGRFPGVQRVPHGAQGFFKVLGVLGVLPRGWVAWGASGASGAAGTPQNRSRRNRPTALNPQRTPGWHP